MLTLPESLVSALVLFASAGLRVHTERNAERVAAL